MLEFREFYLIKYYLIKYSRNSRESDSFLSIFTIYSSGVIRLMKKFTKPMYYNSEYQ